MKGVMLLSGGIDSPVAMHLISKVHDIEALHFSNGEFAGKESVDKSILIAKKLGLTRLMVIDIAHLLKEIATKCSRKYYFVLMKRFMLRIAEKIALLNECAFICTGDSLAQVSSQTMKNLEVVDAVTPMPVLRPLIGYDKEEIILLAKEIGTFDLSKGPEMCDILGPKHPATKARLEHVMEEEKKINVAALVDNAVASARWAAVP